MRGRHVITLRPGDRCGSIRIVGVGASCKNHVPSSVRTCTFWSGSKMDLFAATSASPATKMAINALENLFPGA